MMTREERNYHANIWNGTTPCDPLTRAKITVALARDILLENARERKYANALHDRKVKSGLIPDKPFIWIYQKWNDDWEKCLEFYVNFIAENSKT
jgi:hypothetical protein